ncbi:hypothetical protein AC249_AIPGENE12531 [Exaiptasia diaphana]|nr:hypothetical protein AC249_AIPGENE12531 [Exaiptasia diaphana]
MYEYSIRTYFKTRKRRHVQRQQNKTKEYLKSSRARTRMNTKRQQRKKVLMESTSFSDANREKLLPVLTNAYMSSDESMSDESDDNNISDDGSNSDGENNEPKTKVIVVKKLTWRSDELNQAFKKLDRRLARRRSAKGNSMVIKRREGPPSSRTVPEGAPGWAMRI